MSRLRIALDAMGGDRGPEAVVAAAVRALPRLPDVEFVLVGRQEELEPLLGAARLHGHERVRLVHATEVVGMAESPAWALRNKKQSSMRVALDLHRSGEVDAVVSAGNTGALMATARFVLKMLPGIDRPAIVSEVPTQGERTYLLDMGANTDCTPEQLYQFAVMGAVIAQTVHGLERPKVALLNIGQEELKGIEAVRQAGQLLRGSELNYVGYVEGDGIYAGEVNVVVCDGFAGNIALKSSEGLARLLGHDLRSAFTRNLYARLAALVAYPVLRRVRERMDPRAYNGASLLGLRGIVIKSHGGADEVAFAHAIEIAAMEARHNLPARIGDQIALALGRPQVIQESS